MTCGANGCPEPNRAEGMKDCRGWGSRQIAGKQGVEELGSRPARGPGARRSRPSPRNHGSRGCAPLIPRPTTRTHCRLQPFDGLRMGIEDCRLRDKGVRPYDGTTVPNTLRTRRPVAPRVASVMRGAQRNAVSGRAAPDPLQIADCGLQITKDGRGREHGSRKALLAMRGWGEGPLTARRWPTDSEECGSGAGPQVTPPGIREHLPGRRRATPLLLSEVAGTP
jgi:hypothetical protein